MEGQKKTVTKAPTEKKNRPSKTYRLGNISLAEWTKVSGEGVEFDNYTIQRSYLDEKDTTGGPKGTWKNTHSFGHGDILKLINLLSAVFYEKTSQSIVRRGEDGQVEEEDGF